MFLALNGLSLKVPTEEAIATVLAIAAGELDEDSVAMWLSDRVERRAVWASRWVYLTGENR